MMMMMTIILIKVIKMLLGLVLIIIMISQRKLEVGFSAIAYNEGWTPRGVVFFANNIWVEVK